MDEAHHAPVWVKISPFIAMLIGFITALWFYIWDPAMPARVAANQRPLYLFLLNKWYFDELYDLIFVNPAKWLGRVLWKGGDGRIIDGFGPDGIAATVMRVARRASALQSGYLYHYAFAMLIGVAVLVSWYYLSSGGGH